MQGWIKLHRKLLESDMWKSFNSQYRDVCITCMLLANHKTSSWEWNGDIYDCKPGQFITSLKSLRQHCAKDVSIQHIRSALTKMVKWQFLTNQSTKTGRLITICKWDTYQNNESPINKAINKDLTKHQQSSNKALTTNKNDKNEKNEKKLLYSQQQLSKIVSQWNQFAKQKANQDDIAIEYSYVQAKAKWGDDVLPQAIENYRQALLLPNSQAWEKPLGAFLKDLEKYLPGIFNLNNFDKTNFEKNKKESAVERAKRLEAKNAG